MAKKVEIVLLRATVLAGGEIGRPREEPYDVSEALAADLVQRGRARLVHEAPSEDDDADADRDALLDAVESAVRALRPDDFGSDGKPKVEPIRKLLPQDAKAITSAVRDEVWDDLLEQGFEAPARK